MQALQHMFHEQFFPSDWIIAPKCRRGADWRLAPGLALRKAWVKWREGRDETREDRAAWHCTCHCRISGITGKFPAGRAAQGLCGETQGEISRKAPEIFRSGEAAVFRGRMQGADQLSRHPSAHEFRILSCLYRRPDHHRRQGRGYAQGRRAGGVGSRLASGRMRLLPAASRSRRGGTPRRRRSREALEHDPEKWVPVFREDHAQTNKIKRDDISQKSHLALDHCGPTRSAGGSASGSGPTSFAAACIATIYPYGPGPQNTPFPALDSLEWRCSSSLA